MSSLADNLICAITLELPWEPVTAEDGRVYEREAIERHIEMQGDDLRSPLTRQPMGDRHLPAFQHKSTIESLIENGSIQGDHLAEKWNEKKRMDALLKDAEGGDKDAMFALGVHFYDEGPEGPSEAHNEVYFTAFEWFNKAHVEATVMLGLLFFQGRGCEQSYTEALMYGGIAAGQGSDLGAYLLGVALGDAAETCGVKRNIPEAVRWLRKVLDGSCQYKNICACQKKTAQEILSALESEFDESSTA